MSVLTMVGGCVVLFLAVVGILVVVSRSQGASSWRADALEDDYKRRKRFDKVTSRPVAQGDDLIARLRRWSQH